MTPTSLETHIDHVSNVSGWRGRRGLILAIALVGVASLASILAINLLNPWQCFFDEGSHAAQMYMFLRGDHYNFRDNATFPTYHAVVSSFAGWFHTTSVPGMRVVSLLLGLLCLSPAISIGRSLHPSHAGAALLQFVFLPILFPFFFLLYTDVFALLFVLGSVAMALNRRPGLAGLAAIAAVTVRQNMIVWLTFVFFLLYVQEHGWRITASSVSAHLRKCWIFIVGAIAFVAFVIINNGVAMGDQQHHPGSSFHLDNHAFILVIVAILWLPLHIANAKSMVAMLRKPLVWCLIVVGLAVYLSTFGGDHPYNRPQEFLRNKLIAVMDRSRWHMLAFYPLIVFSALSLAVTRFERREFLLVFVFWFFALLPEGLIEQRYSIPAMALILLGRKPGERWLEWSMTAVSIAVSAFFIWGIAIRRFFL